MQETICTAETIYTKQFHRSINLAYFKYISWKRTVLASTIYFILVNLGVFAYFQIKDLKLGVPYFLLHCTLPFFVMAVIAAVVPLLFSIHSSYKVLLRDGGGATPVYSYSFSETGFIVDTTISVRESIEQTYAKMFRIIVDDKYLLFVFPSKRRGLALELSSLNDPESLLSVLSRLTQFRDRRKKNR